MSKKSGRDPADTESAGAKETRGFQTEVRQLLHLMIHSLYSNKEIFLRELISNASDAADKLRFEALAAPELLDSDAEFRIRIEFDAEAGTIAVTDNGIGMSRQDLIDNIGTIARSGTAEFLQRMTGDVRKDAQLIGQFGVGFYSAFIVSDRVTVETRKAGLAAEQGVRWESDGQGEYTVGPLTRTERGTRVTLFLKKSEREFCDKYRLQALIRKYSDHIAFPVHLADAADPEQAAETINAATALWTRPRNEISDEEYREFYKYLTHDISDPLCWSHNRVEGRREYVSLLYVPATAPFDLWNRDTPRGLKLYVQRVFIMDDAEQFLPLYLRFVRGIVDAADLPLNISRELLQQHPELEGMRSALTRRVLDMLQKLAQQEPEAYTKFWPEFGSVLKEGIIEDPANRDRLATLLRFATTHTGDPAQDQSLGDYLGRMPDGQDRIYYVLGETHTTASASPHLEQLRKRGIEVLLLSDRIDSWLVEHLAEYDGRRLQDVSRGRLELPEGGGELTQQALDEEHKPLLRKIKQKLRDRVEAVTVSQRLVDSAACIVTGEQDLPLPLRRVLEASGQQLPEAKPILEINITHPLVGRLSAECDDARFAMLSNILLDHALLADGAQLPNPADYVQRINALLLEPDGAQPTPD